MLRPPTIKPTFVAIAGPPVITSTSPCYGPAFSPNQELVINGRSLRDPTTGQGAWIMAAGADATSPAAGNTAQTILENTDTRIRVRLGANGRNSASSPVSISSSIWVSTGAGAVKVCTYHWLAQPYVNTIVLYKSQADMAAKRTTTSLSRGTGGVVEIFGDGLVDPANTLSNPVRINGGTSFQYLAQDPRRVVIQLPPLQNIAPGIPCTGYSVKVPLTVSTPYGSTGPYDVKYIC